MPFPVVPVALTAAGATIAYLLLHKKPGTPGSAPQAPGKSLLDNILPPSPSVSPAGDVMPADVKAAYEELLARGTDPDKMEICADKLESLGFKAEALKLRTRAAQLRAQRPAPKPNAPPPPTAPAALPTLSYQPDLTPMPQGGPNGTYYYNPANGKRAKIDVRQDAKALRFLGYSAPVDPGGGNGLGADSSTGQGSWHPQLQSAVTQFQRDEGLTADGWLGPQTLTRLGQRVSQKNAKNAADNRARGVTDVVFAGQRGTFGLAIPAKGRKAFVRAPGGLRLRSQPQMKSSTVGFVGANERVDLSQVIPGEKLEAVSPGNGGWALVTTGMREHGWVPMEWLALLPAE